MAVTFVWQKQVAPARGDFWTARIAHAGAVDLARLVTVETRRSVRLEVCCTGEDEARALVDRFGGRVRGVPDAAWQIPAPAATAARPLRIGRRLLVTGAEDEATLATLRAQHPRRVVLSIPAALAFGTGEHATTAMCLRLLDEVSREFNGGGEVSRQLPGGRRPPGAGGSSAPLEERRQPGSPEAPSGARRSPATGEVGEDTGSLWVARSGVGHPWDALDLGTGSGILAFAARLLGAATALGLENDPLAVRTARENARRHGFTPRTVQLRRVDLRRWSPGDVGGRTWPVVTANLFSALLVELLPTVIAPALAPGGHLIVSGVLAGEQEAEVGAALRRQGLLVRETRRRGKWVAFHALAPAA